VRQLLWKEWNEVKGYLLLLAVGPWVFALAAKRGLYYSGLSRGFSAPELAGGLAVPVILVVFLWAATRVESKPNNRNLCLEGVPAGALDTLCAKFLPGLAVALLIPFWLHIAACVAMGSPFQPAWEVLPFLKVSACAYCFTFALSLRVPATIATITAIPVSMVVFSYASFQANTVLEFLALPYVWLTTFSLILLLISWFTGESSPWRGRVALSCCTILAVMGMALWSVHGLPHRTHIALEEEATWLDWYAPVIVDKSQRAVAYVAVPTVGNDEPRGHQEQLQNKPPEHPKAKLKVWISGKESVVAQAGYVSPYAWLPNGRLVFGATDNPSTLYINDWDPQTGETRKLALFRSTTAYGMSSPVGGFFLNQDGSRAAVFADSYVHEGADLWILDLRHGGARVICADRALSSKWMSGYQGEWRRDTLVFITPRDELRSICVDGTSFKLIAGSPHMEGSDETSNQGM